MTNRAKAKAKASSRKSRKPRKATKSPRRRNPLPQLPSPTEPGAQKLARRSSGRLQTAPPSSLSEDSIRRVLELTHPEALGGLTYSELAKATSVSTTLQETAVGGAANFTVRMGAKDPLESLAATQALLAHARVTHLSNLLVQQTEAAALAVISEAAERAAGTFARLMRAIAEYRRPTSSSATVSIGQANLARQQVIQNIQKQELQEKNDDDRTKIASRGAAVTAEILSADAERTGVAADRHPTNAPVEEEHRTSNAGRKSPSQDERAKTRRALRGSRRPQATDEGNDSKTARPRGGPQRTMKTRASNKSWVGGRKPTKK